VTLFTEAIQITMGAARTWPLTVVSRETDSTHLDPGHGEIHLTCQHQDCGQSVFRLWPLAIDGAGRPAHGEYQITLDLVAGSVGAHIRQCHEALLDLP
jgi:hypothetical protein